MASAIILMFALWNRTNTKIHVLQLINNESFTDTLLFWKKEFEKITGIQYPESIENFNVIYPTSAASYGSVNAEVIKSYIKYARMGIITEPIYSTKLIMACEHMFNNTTVINGNTLILHSGNSISSFSYRDTLNKYLNV